MTNQNPKPKTPKPKRNNHFNIRLFDDELQKLTLKAQSYNMNNADYLRQVIADLPPPIERRRDLPKVNENLIRQIASIGNNINQLTKLAHQDFNSVGTIDVATLHKSLERISNELALLREQYTVSKDD